MGGVAKPVEKAVQTVTKPVVKVAQSVGLVEKPKAAPAPAAAAPAAEIKKTAMSEQAVAAREQAEDVMARRRARRGGRALLSDVRLNPEAGVQTLGSGSQL